MGKANQCYDSAEAECVQGCEGQYSQFPECKEAIDALYNCAIDNVPTQGCELKVVCPDESNATDQCMFG